MFWKPRFLGCTGCPANLLLVDGSRSIWDAVNAIDIPVSLVLLGVVQVLIIRHWRSARGWARQALVPLGWIRLPIRGTAAGEGGPGDPTLPFPSRPFPVLIPYADFPPFALAGP